MGAAGLVLAGLPLPASAELVVRVSPPAAGVYQTVLVTAEDPDPSPETPAGGEVVTLTMADARDARRSLLLLPAGPHRWAGRFTPESAGRHTGTVVLEADDAREIGLVPLLQVKPSGRRGFVRSLAPRGRMFECNAGGLFPMGVDLTAAAPAETEWKELSARLRRQGANYVRVGVPWANGEEAELAGIDRCLLAAEEAGLFVQLRLAGPAGADPPAAEAYEKFLQEAAVRWGPFASLAAWELDARAAGDPARMAALLAALSSPEVYRHLVTVEVPAGEAVPPGIDFPTSEPAPGAAVGEPGLCLAPPPSTDAAPDLWPGLFSPGIGLPLIGCRPGEDPGAALAALPAVAEVAKTVPWAAPPRVRPADDPEGWQWASYGQLLLARPTRAGAGALVLQGCAPAGRLRAYGADGRLLDEKDLRGSRGVLSLPGGDTLEGACFACLAPAGRPAAVGLKAARRTHSPRTRHW
jgi:hypothetical protein